MAFQYQMNGLSMGESYLIAVAGYTKKGVGKKSDSVTVHLQTTTVDVPATTPTTSTVAQQTTGNNNDRMDLRAIWKSTLI